MIKETIGLLGKRAEDKVTGMKGLITSCCFDLYGCVQCVIHPAAEAGKEAPNGHWYDVQRLIIGDERVMPVPNFDGRGKTPKNYDSGPAIKPAPGV